MRITHGAALVIPGKPFEAHEKELKQKEENVIESKKAYIWWIRIGNISSSMAL